MCLSRFLFNSPNFEINKSQIWKKNALQRVSFFVNPPMCLHQRGLATTSKGGRGSTGAPVVQRGGGGHVQHLKHDPGCRAQKLGLERGLGPPPLPTQLVQYPSCKSSPKIMAEGKTQRREATKCVPPVLLFFA